jgi:hypothetical protein
MAIRQSDALAGKLIDMRCFDYWITIAAKIAITKVIHQKDDNVWP